MSLDHDAGFVKRQTCSEDAFLGGRIIVSQPRAGFRAGMDSVLLGAAVAADSASLCDLGAGAGTAAMVAMAQLEALTAVLVEIQPALAALAASNIERNGFALRAQIIEADVAGPGAARHAAGLLPDSFSSVIANPPFFAAGGGTPAPNGSRATARHMPRDALDNWLRTAASLAAPDGEAIVIYPAAGLADLLSAFAPRFGALTVLPLSPHPGADATRVLVRGRKGSRAPLRLLAGRAVHAQPGGPRSEGIESILRGNARLDW